MTGTCANGVIVQPTQGGNINSHVIVDSYLALTEYSNIVIYLNAGTFQNATSGHLTASPGQSVGGIQNCALVNAGTTISGKTAVNAVNSFNWTIYSCLIAGHNTGTMTVGSSLLITIYSNFFYNCNAPYNISTPGSIQLGSDTVLNYVVNCGSPIGGPAINAPQSLK